MKKTIFTFVVSGLVLIAAYCLADNMGMGMDMGMSDGGGSGGTFPAGNTLLLANASDKLLLVNGTDGLELN